MAGPEQKTEPVLVEPERIIENVYEQDGAPDIESRDNFEHYLVERMHGPDSFASKKFTPGSDHTTSEWERDGWLLRPRTALIATVAASAALSLAGVKMPIVNGLVNKFIVDPAGDLIDKISPKYNTHKITTHTPGKPKKESETMDVTGPEQRSGEAEKEKAEAKKLVKRISVIEAEDGTDLTSVTITGTASDEWLGRGDRSLGVSDPGNVRLAEKRAETFKRTMIKIADKENIDLPKIETKGHEAVLQPAELGELLTAANKYGYGSIGEAIRSYNSGKKLPGSLDKLVASYIGDERTVVATIGYQKAQGKTTTATTTHVERTPVDENHKLPFAFLPIPPIPFYRRRTRQVFGEPPVLPPEPPEQVEFELYKEAKKANGDLVDESWALTRKYQALLREERIKTLSTFEYTDEDGDQQMFRVGFVDHEPADETIEAVSGLLKSFSLMNRGKIPERLNMIAVYPSEQTGPQKNPKKIGLGIDEQYRSDTLGLAIPALGLVEMHMPAKPTQKDLDEFMGMRWIMAHEVAGHFTDVKNQPVRITKASSHRRGKRNYTASNPWKESTGSDYGAVGSRGTIPVESRQFAIPSQRPEDDPAQTDEYIVNPDDPRLAQAGFVRLSRMAPTNYAEEHYRELQAETAAQVTTGILIPFEQAGVKPGKDWKAKGYAVDAGLLHTFARRVGSGTNTDYLSWTEQQLARGSFMWTESEPDNYEGHHKLAETAKKTPYQPDDQRLRIVTEQTQ